MTSGQAICWVPGATGSLYDVDNLPYGVFSTSTAAPRPGLRIGNYVLDLAGVSEAFRPDLAPLFAGPDLDLFLASGPLTWRDVRAWAGELLTDERNEKGVLPYLVPLARVALHLAFSVGDYVDFYCSLEHATNVGRIFRPGGQALMENWRHLPVGYHGRSSSVVVSGTSIVRPSGQRRVPGTTTPTFGVSESLDIEAELAFVVGAPSDLGTPVPVHAFADHVFGVAGFNDWSARDIQAWEYVPLGPFLGKSFASTIGAWITPLEALSDAWVPLPGQDPEPLDYLTGDTLGLDIDVEVEVNGAVLARPRYRDMYWSPAQMLAHMTVNGARLTTGDVFASGTISGSSKEQQGSLLELTWNGSEPVIVGTERRTFLRDGDEVVLTYTAPGRRGRIGLGEVRGRIAVARL